MFLGLLSRMTRLFLAALCVLALTSGAIAQDKPLAEQLLEYERALAEQADDPGAPAAAQDIDLTREWLAQARTALEQGKTASAEALLRRAGMSLEMIEALVKVGAIQKAADDQEAALHAAQTEQIPQLEQEVKQLSEQKAALEAELRGLQ